MLPVVDMSTTFAWPSVSVKRSAALLVTRKVVKIEWENTFGELLEKIGEEYRCESVEKVAVCGNQQFRDPVHDVPLDGPMVLCQTYGMNVCFHLIVIVCGECTKPRCVYARSKLCRAESVAVENVKDSHLYTCGSSIFPPSSEYYDSIVLRENITCSDPIELQYFSSTLVHYPPLCYWCGNAEETLVRDEDLVELQRKFQTVRPICFFCISDGKSPFTRHPLNSAKRARKS